MFMDEYGRVILADNQIGQDLAVIQDMYPAQQAAWGGTPTVSSSAYSAPSSVLQNTAAWGGTPTGGFTSPSLGSLVEAAPAPRPVIDESPQAAWGGTPTIVSPSYSAPVPAPAPSNTAAWGGTPTGGFTSPPVGSLIETAPDPRPAPAPAPLNTAAWGGTPTIVSPAAGNTSGVGTRSTQASGGGAGVSPAPQPSPESSVIAAAGSTALGALGQLSAGIQVPVAKTIASPTTLPTVNATRDADIAAWFANHPGWTPDDLRHYMASYGISPEQVARATGNSPDAIISLYNNAGRMPVQKGATTQYLSYNQPVAPIAEGAGPDNLPYYYRSVTGQQVGSYLPQVYWRGNLPAYGGLRTYARGGPVSPLNTLRDAFHG